VREALRVARVAALEAVDGLVHGFERRPAFPERAGREADRRRVGEALAGLGSLCLLRQVHGAKVHAAPWRGTPEGDAGISSEPGVLVGIETADCLPLFLVDPRRQVAAAVHAGWRGTAAGVAREAVVALRAAGSEPADLMAALGPAIGVCCYEVGDDVRRAFGPGGASFFRPGRGDRSHLDVRAANVAQLLDAGIPEEGIHHVAECTRCRPDLYHSYRREGKGAGRMINYLGWARRAPS
jgi:YfiH family protein